ncbi:lysophospholipase L1-like esterase [Cryobacterium sp. CAN_C3]|uniref:SGNH/GDSL hydrolase family protein n=1 Tax=unclassified Cryobacterium TaxID=2649013 RepID=UPI0018CA0E3B|nr:SGNH/GDSL hydrolase family protein [Cryobacterium sp. CAN_C3]MEC5155143.1 lysophospholipase L1-like esterase [Cryobacterium sp. CAN_C3]
MMNPQNKARLLTRTAALSVLVLGLVAGVSAMPAAATPAMANATIAQSGLAAASSVRSGASPALDYVAIGDSFTAGQGAPPYDLSSGVCLRSRSSSYPTIVSVLSPFRLPTNRACSGATVENVHQQLDAITSSPGLVTLTVGGIDAGSNQVLAACADYPVNPNSTCLATIALSQQKTLALATTLPTLYVAIAAKFPRARIAVLGYPLLFEPAVPPVGDLVNAGTVGLNSVIAASEDLVPAALGGNRIRYVDPTQEFAGHGIGSRIPFISFDPSNPAAPANFHPNALGNALGYYRALLHDGLLRR